MIEILVMHIDARQIVPLQPYALELSITVAGCAVQLRESEAGERFSDVGEVGKVPGSEIIAGKDETGETGARVVAGTVNLRGGQAAVGFAGEVSINQQGVVEFGSGEQRATHVRGFAAGV